MRIGTTLALWKKPVFPQSTRRSLPMALLRARESVMSQFRPMLASHDVTEQQWRVLRVLAEGGPLEATQVAEQAAILAPSLTRIIKTLEERKLVLRRKGKEDGRRVILAIAREGSLLIEKVAPEQRRIYRQLEERYGVKLIEQLLDLLERFF